MRFIGASLFRIAKVAPSDRAHSQHMPFPRRCEVLGSPDSKSVEFADAPRGIPSARDPRDNAICERLRIDNDVDNYVYLSVLEAAEVL